MSYEQACWLPETHLGATKSLCRKIWNITNVINVTALVINVICQLKGQVYKCHHSLQCCCGERCWRTTRVGSKNPAPAGPRGGHFKTRPAPPRRFYKVTIREGYSGAERRKKVLRYFCLREARGGAGRAGFFSAGRGGAGEFFWPNFQLWAWLNESEIPGRAEMRVAKSCFSIIFV